MTTNASRAPVDFDAFARDLQPPQNPQLQGAAPEGSPARAPHANTKSDPLAELARIIGQDDPFRAILAARDARFDAASGRRIEPSVADVQAPPADPVPPLHRASAYQPPVASSSTDAFDQYLASVGQDPYPSQGAEAEPRAEQDAFASGERVATGRPRQRSRLVSVGAGLGVLALCITGGLAWRGLHSGGGKTGGVPTILADTAPLKIAPLKSDGVEIPDQNKQIYDRTAKDGQIRIVNREEQPLDVAQAARSAQGAGEGGATPGSAGATPGGAGAQQTGTLTESLGEPRRVRTVSVKPDTPVPPPEVAEPPPASVIPTMTLPGASAEGTTSAGSLRPRNARVSTPLSAAMPSATPIAEVSPPAPVVPAPRVKAPQRVAAVAPETTAAVASPPPATMADSPAPAAGSFSVQLGVRNSASEAQAAFKQMQGKYASLAGQPALIRQAEVNGKALYRVRVGPLGKNEAASLCTQIQGAGGQCFVAKN